MKTKNPSPQATPTRPLLRYFGGKWRIAPWIISHFPVHRIYVEPFGGAASVLLRKPRSRNEIYNDMDGELVNLFRVARDNGDELSRLVSLTPVARDEFDLSYQPTDDPIEQARRTVIRSFMAFGSSGQRKSRTGFGATSRRGKWTNYHHNLIAIIERLQNVIIENKPAIDIMLQQDSPQTLHYVDPPYVPETRTIGVYRHEMTKEDHNNLADVLHNLKGMVVLSGYRSNLYDLLYSDWERVEKTTYAEGRRQGTRQRTECLWLSPNCQNKPTLFEI
ncbi:MAG: DNA adenine methylase [Planctomycetota bacterium]|nr:DNA adenine methylase [Planctomycetota bacterium]